MNKCPYWFFTNISNALRSVHTELPSEEASFCVSMLSRVYTLELHQEAHLLIILTRREATTMARPFGRLCCLYFQRRDVAMSGLWLPNGNGRGTCVRSPCKRTPLLHRCSVPHNQRATCRISDEKMFEYARRALVVGDDMCRQIDILT
jgi:hypothetical protein